MRTPKQNLEYLARWAERNADPREEDRTGMDDFDFGYASAASWVRDILNDTVTFSRKVTD